MNSTHLLLFPAWDEITRIKLPSWREREERERRHTERREKMTNHSENGIRLSRSPQKLFHNSLKQSSLFFFLSFSFVYFFLYVFFFALSQSSAQCSD